MLHGRRGGILGDPKLYHGGEKYFILKSLTHLLLF